MKRFLVIGLGRFGNSVALMLARQNCEVMVIDRREEAINLIRDEVTYAVIGDSTDSEVLEKIGVRNFDAVIVCISGSMEDSIMTTALLKEMGVEKVITKGKNDLHAKVLRKLGADKVVQPERDMGMRLAQMLNAENVMDYIELSPTLSIIELSIPLDWVGKSIIDLDVRKRYKINILAIKKKNGSVDATPSSGTVFEKEDIIVVLGEKDSLEKL
ncbi:MAG: TrkA family potassium uptake protein [Ruminococcaceae bacterium]|nr:TrkA family potassium uptake protein [Oscillospiraceae bacterium]